MSKMKTVQSVSSCIGLSFDRNENGNYILTYNIIIYHVHTSGSLSYHIINVTRLYISYVGLLGKYLKLR